MRVMLATLAILGVAGPAFGQSAKAPQSKPSDEKEIVVTGLADGARVVEVDFDKVWKGCAECKRALAKLDKLARNYRDELDVAQKFAASPGSHCGGGGPSSQVMTFQRSSANDVGNTGPTTPSSIVAGLCSARSADQSQRTFQAVAEKYVVPEQGKMLAYMRSFLDQLSPHIVEATEAERIANGASAGLVDTKRTKLSAKSLKRIDVTKAVIGRLDAKDFTIVLPDPPKAGPARGRYEPIKR